MQEATDSLIARRDLLRIGALAGVGMATLLGGLGVRQPRAQGISSYCNSFGKAVGPHDALQALIDGNKRWATGMQTHPGEDPSQRECNAEHFQTPFAAILSCVDSRVPPALIFDWGIGDLFVARVAGNSVVPILEDSLRYGTESLGAAVLFVLGHTACGAISAAVDYYLRQLADNPYEESIPEFAPADPSSKDSGAPSPEYAFIPPILPAVKVARRIVKQQGGDPNDPTQVIPVATNQHVILTVEYLSSRPPFRRLVKDDKLLVKGGVYDIGTYWVTVLI